MHIYDLTPLDQVTLLVANGYLREQFHPTEPLAIFNYTDRAMTKPEIFRQYPALNYCRGLIYNTDDGEIVARPFKKFWNRGQENAARIRPTDRVEVIDKVDGSLGILYRLPSTGALAIATRGSFTSDQALHATELLRDKYADWIPMRGETVLFEIVYPENRIVLDYGDTDDLVLLGSVEIDSGDITGSIQASWDLEWMGPTAPVLLAGKWQDVMKTIPLNRENREGVVVRVAGGGLDRLGNMVKLKQEDYLILHRAVFGLSTRRIYEAIMTGTFLEEILKPLPDEFHDWTTKVHDEFYAAFGKRERELRRQYRDALSYTGLTHLAGVEADGPIRDERVRFAQYAKESPDSWALFAQLDGKDISARIWKDLQPPAGQTPSVYTPKEV